MENPFSENEKSTRYNSKILSGKQKKPLAVIEESSII
jgi:hypothetical protein